MPSPESQTICLNCAAILAASETHCNECGSSLQDPAGNHSAYEEDEDFELGDSQYIDFSSIFQMAEELEPEAEYSARRNSYSTKTVSAQSQSLSNGAGSKSSDYSEVFQMAEDAKLEKTFKPAHDSEASTKKPSEETMASIEIEGETPLPENRKATPSPQSDLIRLSCKNCGRKLRIKKSRAGQRIKCPKCEHKIFVPGPRDQKAEGESSSNRRSGLAEKEIRFAELARQLETPEKKPSNDKIPVELSGEDKKSAKKKTLSGRKYRQLTKALEEKGLLAGDKIRLRADALREFAQSGDGRAYDWLVADLEHNELPVRQAAVVGLGDLADPRCVPLLVAMLDEDSMVLRKAAILGLGKVKDPRAIKPLLLFGLEDPQMKFLASEAVADMGAEAVQPLIELLDESELGLVLEAIVLLGRLKDSRARRALAAVIDSRQSLLQCHAIEALGQIADPKSIGPLARLLDSPDANVRVTAVTALSKMAFDKNIVAPLVKALKDPDEDVVVQAARGLGESGDQCAAEPLSRFLKSPHEKIRVAAAQALGALGDQRAVPHLLALLDEESEETQIKVLTTLRTMKPPHISGQLLKRLDHPSPAVRRRVVDVLGPIGDAEVAEQLEHVLRVDPAAEVRMAAARALGEIADPASVDCLKEALHNDEFNVRCQAIGALGGIGDEECYNTLLMLLEEQVPEVRFHAAVALGEVGHTKAVLNLKALLKDKNSMVVRGASKALEKLGESDVENQIKLAQRSRKMEALHGIWDTVKSWLPDTARGQKVLYGRTLAGLLLILGFGWLAAALFQEPPKRIFLRGNVGSVSFAGNGELLIAGRTRGVVEVWSVSRQSVEQTMEVDGSQRVFATPDPNTLAIIDRTAVKLWKMDGAPSPEAKAGHAQPIFHWVQTPDQSQVATLSRDGVAIVWDLKTGNARQGVKLPPTHIKTFSVSADGTLFAGGNDKGQIMIWDAATGQVKLELPWGKPNTALAFSPDGKTLVGSFTKGPKLVAWEVETAKVVAQVHDDSPAAFIKLAYDPTGQFLVALSINSASVWPVDSLGRKEAQPKLLPVKAGTIDTFAFPAPGGRLALGSSEKSPVWIYDLASGTLTATLDVAK